MRVGQHANERVAVLFDQAPDHVGDAFAREGAAVGVPSQGPQMSMFRLAEPQRASQSIDGGDRRADGPSLFQPDVPIDTDAGEFGHLLTPEAGGAPPPPAWKTNALGG